MAGSQRVQSYLEKHKIGMLFEELMGKVIADQPEEPMNYLIRSLERKVNRQTNQLRRSTDGDKMSVPKERTSYDKPWQSNTKKMKGRDSSGERSVKKSPQPKPEWDHRTKTEADSFDELWGSKEGQRPSKGHRSASPSRKAGGGVSWGDDQDELYSSYGYNGPHRAKEQEADALASEFSIAKGSPVNTQPTQRMVVAPKGKSQQRDSEKHKQQLQKLVLNRKTAEDSGIEDDRDLQDDDAVELMENLDDLRSEGVTNVKSAGGVSVKSTSRQAGSAEAAVRVSICARCAKVMTGEPSEPVSRARPSGYGQLDDSDTELDRNFPASRPQSAVRFSPDTAPGSDEEFESVSQVTGPRRPVWQDDSDAESVTPRKGKHMFASNTVPAKGRHMYSPQPADTPSLKQTAATVARSTNFEQSSSTGSRGGATDLKGHGNFHKTWSPDMDLSETNKNLLPSSLTGTTATLETSNIYVSPQHQKPAEAEDEGTTRTTHSLTTTGVGGWKLPSYGGDDASSFYGSPGNKGRKDLSGPY